ncbi:MAG: FtsQ-type POTRA domain-containing protein [Betaproteobacteria bacterium]|nr:FtsQ-type POTRA domain-containing protein [Betaproteobacteria bacterium]
MWDRPDTLNAIANALYGAAALLALYAAILLVIHSPAFPLKEVHVDGELTHVTREQIESVARRELKGNFFTLDLAATRTAFQTLPWVRRAEVRRHWPDRLEIRFEEHRPLARWADVALVNTHGEVFKASYGGELPLFIGPAGTAKEIAIQFEYFRRSLVPIGETPVQLSITPRRAWQLKLASGLTIELGREQMEARLARFVAVYERTLARLERRLEYVDLRYANGFAVRIPELRDKKSGPPAARRAG